MNQNVSISLNFLHRHQKCGLKISFALIIKATYLTEWSNGEAYHSVLGFAIASSGHIFSPCIMCVQYSGGCSVPWGVKYRGGYHEYSGGNILIYRGGVQYREGIS